jgi:Cu(I)/Ag(I) efflux system membrane fusion protein
MITSNDTNRIHPRRAYGLATVVVAVLIASAAAGGGAWLVAHGAGEGDGHAATAAKEQWQCPMHPTIVQDHPGDCPICGMKLVKVEPGGPGAAAKPAAAEAHETWQCPMHPSIVQDHAGDCPICGMKLVKVEGGGSRTDAHAEHEDVQGMAAVDIDASRQQLIGLRTAEVASGTVGGMWRTVGRVAMDETRVKHINVKVPGFVEHVYVDFVGKRVRRGEALFSIYSPELLSAQEEYLLALRTRGSLQASGGLSRDGDALVQAARRKLQLWDVPASEIERLERKDEPTKNLTLYSPIHGVVTKKDVVEGMKLDAGAMPYEIVDLSEV